MNETAGIGIVDDERERGGRRGSAGPSRNGGDRSGPSHVWRAGIAPPSTKAELDSASWLIVIASVVGEPPPAQPATSDVARVKLAAAQRAMDRL